MAELLDRDLELYQDHCRGMTKVALADKYGVARNTVSAILDRVKAEMPAQDRVHIFDQSLAVLDQGLAVFVPMMLDGDKAAARIVDRYIGRRNALLGLENPQRLELIQAAQETKHQPVDVKAELARLVAEIRGRQDAAA